MSSSTTSEAKNGPEVVMKDDGGDDSSPDSTPLAAGRSLPATASNNEKTAEKDNESTPKAQENKNGEEEKAKETKDQEDAPQPPAEPPSKSTTLARQIQELTSLRRRIMALRDVPGRLITLQSPMRSAFDSSGHPDGIQDTGLMLNDALSTSGTVTTQPGGDETIDSIISSAVNISRPQNPSSLVRSAFQAMEEARKQMLGDLVQGAMKDADLSCASDKSDINSSNKRERKKRKTVLAESPAPFPSLQAQTTIVFPPDAENHRTPFTYNDLLPYLRQKNRGSDRGGLGIKLSIWAKSKASPYTPQVSEPLTLRVKIQDVVTMFLKMTYRSVDHDPIVIESVVAFGPREKQKSPYSHSDFSVYEKMTQSILKMIEQEPNVSFPQMIDYISSFESLFDARCSVCERILSQEGHVPPVARVWTDMSGGRRRWDPRHVSCMHA
ncbi:hypothetical protein SCHPADRAFT_67225 [Schizopora paradoxa]|uniref:Uncharacterized protein n=1 Tax=Schizopora paradoxa TaxID=27342 RepID=A0A0H2S5M5_9AGAM|nr:hypothetical protein SCHPADRAFT_67225 [Schizopora paradoxa]